MSTDILDNDVVPRFERTTKVPSNNQVGYINWQCCCYFPIFLNWIHSPESQGISICPISAHQLTLHWLWVDSHCLSGYIVDNMYLTSRLLSHLRDVKEPHPIALYQLEVFDENSVLNCSALPNRSSLEVRSYRPSHSSPFILCSCSNKTHYMFVTFILETMLMGWRVLSR